MVLDTEIEIIISDLGVVTIEDHELVEGDGSITTEVNKIVLDVKNKKIAGQLPTTDESGRNKWMIASAGLVGVSTLVGLFYFFLNRKNW